AAPARQLSAPPERMNPDGPLEWGGAPSSEWWCVRVAAGAGVARWGRVAAGGACGPGSRRWRADRDLVRFTRTRVWGRPAGGFGAGPGRSRSCRVAGAGVTYRERTAVPCPVR